MSKFIKVGNSYAAIVPRQVLSILGLDPKKAKFNWETDGESLIIHPVKDKDQVMEDAIEYSIKKYRKTLIRLADR